MVAKDYISAMVNANSIIYIDTASLMDITELRRFIENGEDILREKNRRIVVPQAVCLELVRHLSSRNQEKQEKALQVLELLNMYQDIFDVHNKGLNEDDIYAVFADAEILAELTRNKKYFGQLLITNDRALGQDAFELNNQGSCRGHQIMVCFINRWGELRKCDCTNVSFEKKLEDNESEQDDERQSSAKPSGEGEANESVPVPSVVSDKNTAWNVLIPIGTFFLAFFTCRYGNTITTKILSFV